MSNTKVTIIFNITPVVADRMRNEVRNILTAVGEIDINILVYLAINELTLGKTIAHSPAMSMDTKIPSIFPQCNPQQHLLIKQAVMQVASHVYKAFFITLDTAYISTPAVVTQVRLINGDVTVHFNSHEEPRPWDWQYSTLHQ
jgi:hypothetical protein